MHARRRLTVALGVGSIGAAVWIGRTHAERLVLPLLPLHGQCLDSVGGWADLSRGALPQRECRDGELGALRLAVDCCPAAKGRCEPALLLAGDESQALPVRIVARQHALAAGCPQALLALDDLSLPPVVRRARAEGRIAWSGPWDVEEIALHGLWGDALAERAVLGDADALDLVADLLQLDPGVRPAAVRAVGEDPGQALPAALIAASGRPERGPNQPPRLGLAAGVPAPADVLDVLTGSGDATHALLAESRAVRTFVGSDPARLEAALFSPASVGSPPGDVHRAFVAGGGSPGATALAVELAWGPVNAFWTGDAVGLVLPAVAPGVGEPDPPSWWMDGCTAPRRPRRSDLALVPSGVAVTALALALAEQVGAALRAGEFDLARQADALVQLAQSPARWAPQLFPTLARAPSSASAPPWLLSAPLPTAGDPVAAGRRTASDMLATTLPADDLALAAWASWRSGDEDLARLLLREAPAEPWPRYAWRTVAVALGEPSDPAVRPTGCPPALWPGPM